MKPKFNQRDLEAIASAMEGNAAVRNERLDSGGPCHSSFSHEDVEKLGELMYSIGSSKPCDSAHVPNPECGETNIYSHDDILSFSNENGQYLIIRQRRTGPTHGRGGRRRGAPVSERRREVKPEITKVTARTMIDVCGGTIKEFSKALKESINSLYPTEIWPTNGLNILRAHMADFTSGKTKVMYEVVPAPYFVLCTKVPYSQVGAEGLHAMDRYSVCTWLADEGESLCSCVGSTRFRINWRDGIDLREGPEGGVQEEPCLHVRGISNFIRGVAMLLNIQHIVVRTALYDLYARPYKEPLARYLHSQPLIKLVHSDSVAVLSEVAPGSGEMICYTPVRIIKKGCDVYVCAFCDTLLRGTCHHMDLVRNMAGVENEVAHHVAETEGSIVPELGVEDIEGEGYMGAVEETEYAPTHK